MIVLIVPVLAPREARADRTLTLPSAFELAVQANLDLSAAKQHLDQSALQVRSAFSALLPQVNLQGKYTHNYKEASLSFPKIPGADFPSGTIVIQKGEAIDSSLQVAVPLYSPAIFPGLDAAKQSDLVARDTFELTKAQVLFAVATAFYAAAGTDELVSARRHAIEVAQQTLDTASTRLSSGAATRLDVSRAELAVVQAQKDADEASQAQDQAYRALGTLLQLREPFRVASGEVAPSTSAPTMLRPEVKQLQDAIYLHDLEAVTARRRWWPILSAFGIARLSNYAGFTGDPYYYGLGVQLDWAIYDGGSRDIQAQQAEVTKRETEIRLKQENDSVQDEIANAKRAVETKTRSVAAAQRSVELSRESLDLVRVRYEAGQATQLDVLQGQDSLVLAEVGLAQARFDLALAGLTLEQASGSFLAHAQSQISAAR
jgi:outer membrane protein TolC